MLLLWASYAIGAIPIEVTIGKESILSLKNPSERISLASPDIADIKLTSPTEIVINGKKPGITSLIIWDLDGKKFYDVIVSDYTNVRKTESLQAQIKGISPDADVKIYMVGDTIVLTGNLKNEVTKKKIEVLALNYYPKVTNLLSIEEAQQVVLEVRVAQIDKTKLKDLGISALTKQNTWELTTPGLFASPSGTVGGGTKVGPGIGSFDVGTLSPQIGIGLFRSSVAAVLRALAEKDYAKILAEPNLVVRTGETGKFFVGTRVPVQEVTGVGSAATPSITFEEVGIKLNFAPEVLDTDVIRLKIDPAEVSNITRFLTFQGIVAPEIDKRSVSTSVDLKSGESLVLAGLLSEQTKRSIQKMPLFGDIPILGAIFRSTHEELDKTELAFFITPHLVKPTPVGIKTILPEERSLTPAEERELNWIPLPPRSSERQAPEERSGARPARIAQVDDTLEKEVNIFISQYTRAYEYGEIDRFMSLYSASAIENNSLRYDDIRRSYQRNFGNNRYTYTLNNLQMQKNDDIVIVTAQYSIKKIQGDGMGAITSGNIRWTLAREDGTLKIVKVDY